MSFIFTLYPTWTKDIIMTVPSWKNKLYFGDNLDILREHVASESVDLIYLDPSFNSNAACKHRRNPKTYRRSIVLKTD